MIILCDRYSIKRDRYQWILQDTYASRDERGNIKYSKKGKIIFKKMVTYSPKLDQVLKSILDKECGECDSIKELKDFLENANEHMEKLATRLLLEINKEE